MRPQSKFPIIVSLLLAICIVLALAWGVYQKLDSKDSAHKKGKPERAAIPVEVATVEVGAIELQRVFTGTLMAHAEFVVVPKVAGRIEALSVDLADTVKRDQVVAKLDDAEFVQAVASAKADLELEKASHKEAEGLLTIAERELTRLQRMRERGDVSESQLDAARSEQVVKKAQTEVTQARIAGAEADLASAQVRLGYTKITASWQGGNEQRVVAARLVDAGQTVAANTPLLRIVELNPLTAVFFVTERDYGLLQVGQIATIHSDAFPDEVFHGQVERIAPVFSESTRQAQVELLIDNPELRLKPGMFVRATVTLQHADDARIIPQQALTKRNEQQGVFVIVDDIARWHVVQLGFQQNEQVQVLTELPAGPVVTLGQQLLDDGSHVHVVGH